jgi:hypothetical protein
VKKRYILLFILLMGSTVSFTWHWAKHHHEETINDYTNEKYGLDVVIIGDMDEHLNKFTVKRKDKPEDVFNIEFSSKKFFSDIESDNYAESEIISEFNQHLQDSTEKQKLNDLGFDYSHLTHYYAEGNKRRIHDLKTALFLYQDHKMNELDAKRFLHAIPIIETIKEKLRATGNDLEVVFVLQSQYYDSLYKNDNDKMPLNGAMRFQIRKVESVTSREDARKLIEEG